MREHRPLIVDEDQHPVPIDDGTLLGKVEESDWNALAIDVVPHVELGPARKRKDTDRVALVLQPVVEPPEVRPLARWIEAILRRALLVTAGAADGNIKNVRIERLLERCCRTLLIPGPIPADAQVDVGLLCDLEQEGIQLARLPWRFGVEERERQRSRVERLPRELKEDGAFLPERVEQYRARRLRDRVSQNVNRLGFQPIEVRER